MSDQKKISAFVISDFGDSGTEEKFKAGDIVSIAEGSFANYEAAGLVRKPTADDKKAGDAAPKSAA
jgi:transcription antitermination factor NusG